MGLLRAIYTLRVRLLVNDLILLCFSTVALTQIATPSEVDHWTVSQRGSPVPSPTPSVGTPNLIMEFSPSISQWPGHSGSGKLYGFPHMSVYSYLFSASSRRLLRSFSSHTLAIVFLCIWNG